MWRSVALSSSRPTPLIKQGRVLFLLLVATVFAVTGATLPFIFAEVSDEIAHSTRYEPSFNAVQLKTSVARLNAAAALYQAAPSPTRLRALRIAASVVVGWARDIDHGEFGRFTASNPAMQADAKAFQADVGELQNLLASPDRQDLATAVDAEVQRIDPLLNALAAEMLRESTRLSELDQMQMIRAQHVQLAMLVGVVACGIGLFVVVSRQNFSLQRMHREQERLTEKFTHIAEHDALTGLLNRTGFKPVLEEACERARRGECEVALMTLDLDRFKTLNDVFGHAIGDDMLKSTAERIRAIDVGENRMAVARLGGDEFAVLIEGGNARATATAAANEILERICVPHTLGRLSLAANASVGLAFTPNHGLNAEDLALASDIALYRAKAAGRGVVSVYQQTDGQQELGRGQLEQQLIEALASEAFEPYYQPQIDFRTGRIVALEALVRWRHGGSILLPGVFLPFAEATGLIVDIDRALLLKVCRDMKFLPEDIRVSVNLSAGQMFCNDAVEAILDRLGQFGLEPRRLEVEITETMFMANTSRTAEVITALQEAGVSIALDDFGSGYSSLGYLRRFRFDKLKIDKMFMDGVVQDAQGFEILRSISALGNALEQTVVAEGIETQAQADLAALAGCAYGQGYFFARPAPLAETLALIEHRSRPTRPGVNSPQSALT